MKDIFFIQGYKDLPKKTYLLFVCKILLSLNSTMLPLLSLILNNKLQLDLSKTGSVISIITLLGMIGIYIGGILSDSIGPLKTIFIFLSYGCLFYMITIVLPISYFFFIIITLGIFCSMVIGPSMDMIISESVNADGQNRIFSLCYLGTNIGYSIFVVLVTYLFEDYLQIACFMAGLANIIILLLLFIYHKKNKNQNASNEVEDYGMIHDREMQLSIEKVKLSYIMKKNALFFCTVLLFSIVYIQYGFTIPLDLSNNLSNEGVKLYGYLGVLNACLVILFTPFFTGTCDKLSNKKVLSMAGLFYAISFLFLMLFDVKKHIYIIWMVSFTIGEILYSISVSSYISKTTKVKYRSRVYSITNILVLIGYILGQNITGVTNNYGMKSNWTLMCIAALMGAILCSVGISRNKRME